MSSKSVHGTCFSVGGGAVLLQGSSGAGKSDLAYRLIVYHGAHLIADDQVVLSETTGKLTASPCDGWAGQLELRGLGIGTVPHLQSAEIALVVDLVGRGEVPRLPEPAFVTLLGVEVPVIKLHAFDQSTPAKILAAIKHLPLSGFPGEDGRLG
jgi:serine kinase of HPr protein (carbohydrate metabolism regulator)